MVRELTHKGEPGVRSDSASGQCRASMTRHKHTISSESAGRIVTCGLVLTSDSSSASDPPSCRSTASSYPDPPSELVPGQSGGLRKQRPSSSDDSALPADITHQC